MKATTNSIPNNLPFDLPKISLQVISFIEIGFYVLLALLFYYLIRRALLLMSNSGALAKKTVLYRIINLSTFLFPIFIFIFGLTSASQDSLFVSLLFFVIFSIVISFALAGPAKNVFASLLMSVRGDLKMGDYISHGSIEGEIVGIGAFNIVIVSKNGTRAYIPTQQLLQQPYEIHAKKGGPSIVISIPENKLEKKNLERLAHLCPFKRKGSDIRISTLDGKHKLSIEIINREARPWVNQYFENHYQ